MLTCRAYITIIQFIGRASHGLGAKPPQNVAINSPTTKQSRQESWDKFCGNFHCFSLKLSVKQYLQTASVIAYWETSSSYPLPGLRPGPHWTSVPTPLGYTATSPPPQWKFLAPSLSGWSSLEQTMQMTVCDGILKRAVIRVCFCDWWNTGNEEIS